MSDANQRTLQRNKIIAQTAEQVATHGTRLAVDLFKAFIKFIQEMIGQVFGR